MQLQITIGGYQPKTSTLSQSVLAFADGLTSRLGDAVAIKFRNDIAAEGLVPSQMPRLVENGELTMGYLSARTGLKLLGIWDYGFRHITNARGPIRSPADCAGHRLRIVLNDLHPRIFQSSASRQFRARCRSFWRGCGAAKTLPRKTF